jgi:threonine synthase
VTATTTVPPVPPRGPRTATNVTGLRCRECGEQEPLGRVARLRLLLRAARGRLRRRGDRCPPLRDRIEAGPRSLWRYADLLPVLSTTRRTGSTSAPASRPLRPAPRLAARLGLRELWLKDDTRNPSGSFKDRVVTIALSAARALGIDTVACASTGNLANSVSAHAAAAGLPAYVFIPHDLERGKVVGSAVYGANVVAVEGSYDDVNRLCAEVADREGWGFVNVNLRAFYAEGSKTHRVRDRRAARVAAARPRRRAARVGFDVHQDPQGVRRAAAARARRRRAPAHVRCPGDGLLADRGGVRA